MENLRTVEEGTCTGEISFLILDAGAFNLSANSESENVALQNDVSVLSARRRKLNFENRSKW